MSERDRPIGPSVPPVAQKPPSGRRGAHVGRMIHVEPSDADKQVCERARATFIKIEGVTFVRLGITPKWNNRPGGGTVYLIVSVCEHAKKYIPRRFEGYGIQTITAHYDHVHTSAHPPFQSLFNELIGRYVCGALHDKWIAIDSLLSELPPQLHEEFRTCISQIRQRLL